MGGGGLHMNLNNGRFKIYIYVVSSYMVFERKSILTDGDRSETDHTGVGTVHQDETVHVPRCRLCLIGNESVSAHLLIFILTVI